MSGMWRAVIVLVVVVSAFGQEPFPVEIRVDAGETTGPNDPVWAFFGYDEPNYTYMRDGRKLLSQIADLSPVPVYVRAHSMLNTGEGVHSLKWGSTNVYTEDADGNPVYSWDILDRILDTYVDRGMRPLFASPARDAETGEADLVLPLANRGSFIPTHPGAVPATFSMLQSLWDKSSSTAQTDSRTQVYT